MKSRLFSCSGGNSTRWEMRSNLLSVRTKSAPRNSKSAALEGYRQANMLDQSVHHSPRTKSSSRTSFFRDRLYSALRTANVSARVVVHECSTLLDRPVACISHCAMVLPIGNFAYRRLPEALGRRRGTSFDPSTRLLSSKPPRSGPVGLETLCRQHFSGSPHCAMSVPSRAVSIPPFKSA